MQAFVSKQDTSMHAVKPVYNRHHWETIKVVSLHREVFVVERLFFYMYVL